MAVEENLNKSMYKLLILMLKYIPMLISLVYVLNTALSYFYIDIPVLSNLAGMSILPWIFMYLSAIVFWFKDVDAKSEHKLVDYFREY